MIEQQLTKIDQMLKINILSKRKRFIRNKKKTDEYDLTIENQENNDLKEEEAYHHVYAIFVEYHLIIDHPTLNHVYYKEIEDFQ